MTRATILIPAHDEASVIGRTLLHLSRGMALDDFRVVVIANGCSDATAAKARSVLPQARIIETEKAGKCHALNLGYAAAAADKPIVCLDADLDVTAESLAALIEPLLEGRALAACGRMDVQTGDAAQLVRAYYKGWRLNPYFDRGKFGGLFALSPRGAARVFPLPDVISDDEFVRRSFSADELAFARGCHFVARAPVTLASLVRVRRRSLRGAREIGELGLKRPESRSLGAVALRALRQPSNLLPAIVYLGVNAWARLSLRFMRPDRARRWDRDLTTRIPG